MRTHVELRWADPTLWTSGSYLDIPTFMSMKIGPEVDKQLGDDTEVNLREYKKRLCGLAFLSYIGTKYSEAHQELYPIEKLPGFWT